MCLGGEYTLKQFLELLASYGRIEQTPCTNTLEQNGVVERKHRHIVETVQSLLLSASIRREFEGEVVLTTVTLINSIHSSYILGISPFETLYGQAMDDELKALHKTDT